jgi:hypothetical protein
MKKIQEKLKELKGMNCGIEFKVWSNQNLIKHIILLLIKLSFSYFMHDIWFTKSISHFHVIWLPFVFISVVDTIIDGVCSLSCHFTDIRLIMTDHCDGVTHSTISDWSIFALLLA